jgi:hypothetical protein
MHPATKLLLILTLIVPGFAFASNEACIGNFTNESIEWEVVDSKTKEATHYKENHEPGNTWDCVEIKSKSLQLVKITQIDGDQLKECTTDLTPNEWIEVRNSENSDELDCLHFKDGSKEELVEDVTYKETTNTPMLEILGRVFLENPITDATVTVYNDSNKIIGKREDATDKKGLFIISVPFDDEEILKIEITDGKKGKETFQGKLELKILVTKAGTKVVVINAVTSLVSQYSDDNNTNIAEAKIKVKEFLEIPDFLSIYSYRPITGEEYFSHRKFAREQSNSGDSHGEFMEDLSKKIGTGTYSFKPRLLKGIIEDFDFRKFAKEKVGPKIAEFAAKQIYTYIFGDSTKREFDKINTKLDKVLTKLDSIVKQIQDTSDKENYEKKASQIKTRVNKFQAKLDYIQYYSALSNLTDNQFTELDKKTLSLIDDMEDLPKFIHDRMMGEEFSGTMISLYSKAAFPKRYLGPLYYNRVQMNFDYYESLLGKVSSVLALARAARDPSIAGSGYAQMKLKENLALLNTWKVSFHTPNNYSFKNPALGKKYVIDLQTKRIWANQLYKPATMMESHNQTIKLKVELGFGDWILPNWDITYNSLWKNWSENVGNDYNVVTDNFPEWLRKVVGFTNIPKLPDVQGRPKAGEEEIFSLLFYHQSYNWWSYNPPTTCTQRDAWSPKPDITWCTKHNDALIKVSTSRLKNVKPFGFQYNNLEIRNFEVKSHYFRTAAIPAYIDLRKL